MTCFRITKTILIQKFFRKTTTFVLLTMHNVNDNNRRYYRITIYLENVNID